MTGARTAQIAGSARPRSIALLIVGVLAAVCQSNFIIDWILRGGSGMDQIISTLAADGEPNARLLRATDAACAVLVLVLTPFVRAALPPGRWRRVVVVGLVGFAVGAVAAALFSSCGHGSSCTGSAAIEALWHDAASLVSEAGIIASIVGSWVLTRRAGPRWLHRWSMIVIAIVVAVLVASVLTALVSGSTTTPLGAYLQRVQVLATSSWLVALGVLASRSPATRDPAQSQD